jgi:hypothetical protein
MEKNPTSEIRQLAQRLARGGFLLAIIAAKYICTFIHTTATHSVYRDASVNILKWAQFIWWIK